MKAKPKSLALAKFQQAGQLTIAKNKQNKAESKKDKGIDVIQVGSIASAAFLVLWIIASTMVSAVFTVRYMGIVEEDQAWYLLEGSARTAAAEAKAVMESAMQAKSDLIAAIDHGLIKTSYDYAAIESTLVPTMALKPYVHSFEMIFTDRTAGLKIGHREEENGRQLLLQSNGADCYLLGTQGCADLGVPQNRFPAWQAEAMYLNLTFKGGSDSEIISQAQMVAIGKQAGPAEQWLFPPVLDAVQGSGENVTWYPIVRLIFRQPLPAAWAPQQEILCGRISLQVAALSKDHLRDSQLGDNGKTFLVDASGTILSAVQIQDTLAADSVGAMQMRRLTDLPDASWSGSIAGAFRGDRIDAMQVQEGWLAVVVYPLPMPLNMFAIVVVSRAENSSFQVRGGFRHTERGLLFGQHESGSGDESQKIRLSAICRRSYRFCSSSRYQDEKSGYSSSNVERKRWAPLHEGDGRHGSQDLSDQRVERRRNLRCRGQTTGGPAKKDTCDERCFLRSGPFLEGVLCTLCALLLCML